MEELGISFREALLVVVSATLIYLAIIALSRLVGLRSFARMSSFDLATTVAVGAILGRVTLVDTSVAAGVIGLAVFFGLQWLAARTRMGRSTKGVVDPAPLVLVAGGQLIESHLTRAQVNADDVYARIRSGGYGRLDEVTAVIMERTGQMSVITSRDIEARVFSGVRGRELLGIDDQGQPPG